MLHPRSWLLILLLSLSACSMDDEHMGEGGSRGAVILDEEIQPAPEFTAIDQEGTTFSSQQLKGTPWIASFFFTSCETVCPALNTVVSGLRTEFDGKVKYVSISTDPDNDTPEALRAYAQTYGARAGEWWMVRMPMEEMRKVASDGFGVIDPQEPAMHSTRLIAVNARMEIEGYFDSSDTGDVNELRQWISSQP